jgi:hypothetical protein
MGGSVIPPAKPAQRQQGNSAIIVNTRLIHTAESPSCNRNQEPERRRAVSIGRLSPARNARTRSRSQASARQLREA